MDDEARSAGDRGVKRLFRSVQPAFSDCEAGLVSISELQNPGIGHRPRVLRVGGAAAADGRTGEQIGYHGMRDEESSRALFACDSLARRRAHVSGAPDNWIVRLPFRQPAEMR